MAGKHSPDLVIVLVRVVRLEPYQNIVTQDLIVDISIQLFSKLVDKREYLFPLQVTSTQEHDLDRILVLNMSLISSND